jgi:hypothetical protein
MKAESSVLEENTENIAKAKPLALEENGFS